LGVGASAWRIDQVCRELYDDSPPN
jgi:hypothetical protein